MNLINLFRSGFKELIGLSVLSAMGITIAFMVMGMASGFESRTKSDLSPVGSDNSASIQVMSETIGVNALLGRESRR